MAFENHIEFLKSKHAQLKQMLHEEEARPGADEQVLHQLKLKKLGLKDEIARLSQDRKAAA
jgi:hypothetical protein